MHEASARALHPMMNCDPPYQPQLIQNVKGVKCERLKSRSGGREMATSIQRSCYPLDVLFVVDR
jgi:hypothetical protein